MAWKWIEKANTEKDRRFHNFEYLDDCLAWIDVLREHNNSNIQSIISELEMSVWCKDIEKSREESAKTAANICELLDLSEEFKNTVKQTISSLNEKDKNCSKHLIELLLEDIDDSYFALSYERYKQKEKLLQLENEWMPKEDFLESRKKYLKNKVSYGVFNSGYFDQHEFQATQNILNYLEKM